MQSGGRRHVNVRQAASPPTLKVMTRTKCCSCAVRDRYNCDFALRSDTWYRIASYA